MQASARRWIHRRDGADSMVLTAIFLAAAYWGLEALLNVFSPSEISFYRELFGPRVGEMGMRVIAVCLFLLFGSHVQYTINERRRAEQALRASEEKYRTILETIEERRVGKECRSTSGAACASQTTLSAACSAGRGRRWSGFPSRRPWAGRPPGCCPRRSNAAGGGTGR